jgi:hypothetical protein
MGAIMNLFKIIAIRTNIAISSESFNRKLTHLKKLARRLDTLRALDASVDSLPLNGYLDTSHKHIVDGQLGQVQDQLKRVAHSLELSPAFLDSATSLTAKVDLIARQSRGHITAHKLEQLQAWSESTELALRDAIDSMKDYLNTKLDSFGQFELGSALHCIDPIKIVINQLTDVSVAVDMRLLNSALVLLQKNMHSKLPTLSHTKLEQLKEKVGGRKYQMLRLRQQEINKIKYCAQLVRSAKPVAEMSYAELGILLGGKYTAGVRKPFAIKSIPYGFFASEEIESMDLLAADSSMPIEPEDSYFDRMMQSLDTKANEQLLELAKLAAPYTEVEDTMTWREKARYWTCWSLEKVGERLPFSKLGEQIATTLLPKSASPELRDTVADIGGALGPLIITATGGLSLVGLFVGLSFFRDKASNVGERIGSELYGQAGATAGSITGQIVGGAGFSLYNIWSVYESPLALDADTIHFVADEAIGTLGMLGASSLAISMQSMYPQMPRKAVQIANIASTAALGYTTYGATGAATATALALPLAHYAPQQAHSLGRLGLIVSAGSLGHRAGSAITHSMFARADAFFRMPLVRDAVEEFEKTSTLSSCTVSRKASTDIPGRTDFRISCAQKALINPKTGELLGSIPEQTMVFELKANIFSQQVLTNLSAHISGSLVELDQAYAYLGLPKDSTLKSVRSLYRHIVRDFHPDKTGHLGVTPETRELYTDFFIKVAKAKECIEDAVVSTPGSLLIAYTPGSL